MLNNNNALCQGPSEVSNEEDLRFLIVCNYFVSIQPNYINMYNKYS